MIVEDEKEVKAAREMGATGGEQRLDYVGGFVQVTRRGGFQASVGTLTSVHEAGSIRDFPY